MAKTGYTSIILKTLFIPLICIANSSALELEYFQIVKRHFDVPEKAVQSAQHGNVTEDGEISITAFGLTILVFAIISILLTIVITYFCFSFITGFIRFILMHRHKNPKCVETGTETETSSLDSAVYDVQIRLQIDV